MLRDERVVDLIATPAQDYGAYRHQAGYIQALEVVLALMGDVEVEMNSNTRDQK